MSGATLKNLRELEDLAPGLGLAELQAIRFAGGELGADRTGIALMGVRPGRRQAVAHRHEAAEEVYVVLSGSGRIKLDDEILEIAPLDAVRIAPGVTRVLEAGSDGLEYLAVGARHDGDGETVPTGEFWTD